MVPALSLAQHRHLGDAYLLPSEFDRIYQAILALGEYPRPPQARRLRGPDFWSRPVGDYRIVYTIDDEAKEVTIYRAWHRREVYRHLL